MLRTIFVQGECKPNLFGFAEPQPKICPAKTNAGKAVFRPHSLIREKHACKGITSG
jgi:hypothetical protein